MALEKGGEKQTVYCITVYFLRLAVQIAVAVQLAVVGKTAVESDEVAPLHALHLLSGRAGVIDVRYLLADNGYTAHTLEGKLIY